MILESSKDYGTGIVLIICVDDKTNDFDAWDHLCEKYGIHRSNGSIEYRPGSECKQLKNLPSFTFNPSPVHTQKKEKHEISI